MSIATGSLTVNAAFLREIKDDNQRVHELLAQSNDLILATSPQLTSPRRLVDTLSALRDQLALHFSLEEAYGYFEDAIEVAPRLSEQAAELRAQHRTLFVNLCGIVDEAEKWLYREAKRDVAPTLSQQFKKFFQDFREHEAREASLILEAFDSDVGVGD